MGPSLLGQLLDNAGHRPKQESPGSAGGHRGPSDNSESGLRGLADLAVPRTLARVGQERLSTPRVIRAGRKSSGRAGRPRRAHDPSVSLPECCSSTQDLGPGTETPGAASQHRGPRYTGPSHPGGLVDPAGPRPDPETPGRTGRPRGPTDPSASRSGELVVPAGTGTRPQVARDIWSSLQAIRHGPESPGRAGRLRGAGTRARVSWVSWSKMWDYGPNPESPETACQPHRPSNPSESRPGEVVDIVGTRILA